MAEAAGRAASLTQQPAAGPVVSADRIESLDVLRGFALLGILLLNIIGFGLPASAYSNPVAGFLHPADVAVWASVELLAEGAMRALFSVLFGAGVVLFTVGAAGKAGSLHYRRNFWLLIIGLFDAYILLWNGDILVNYALAGALLYVVRKAPPRRLLVSAGVLVVLMSAMYFVTGVGMGAAQQAAQQVAAAEDKTTLPPDLLEEAAVWEDFAGGFVDTPAQRAEELALRRDSYSSAFAWNVPRTNEMLTFVLPFVLFWDALAMMLLGMALYKYGVLQGERRRGFYKKLMLAGFSVGLLVNGYEVHRAVTAEFAFLSVFAQAQPTYHIGRLGMAMGYLGLIMLLLEAGKLPALRVRLAAVGRMALTNYLLHSLVCLFVFTGAGLALVGELYRWQLYLVVLAIWILQLTLSPWWLSRFRFGPVEWLWRGLTYGRWPSMKEK